MFNLLWFHGITSDTPLREVGWTYVLVAFLVGLVIHLIGKALKP